VQETAERPEILNEYCRGAFVRIPTVCRKEYARCRIQITHLQPKGVFIIGKSPSLFRGKTFLFFFVFFLPVFIAGCHYQEGVSTTLQREGDVVFDRLAVIPFQQIVPDESGAKVVRCPVCGALFTADGAASGSEGIVENIFLNRIRKSGKVSIVDPERTAAVYRQLSSGASKAEPVQIMKKLGAELGAGGIVAGYVYRYREREGTPYSVKKPASVAYEIHLIRGRDGAQVWRGAFDRTQPALMDDLFQLSSFFRQKGRWATAEELAGEGMEDLLRTFPGLNEGEKD
jgi:hypothetical protein